LSPFYEVNKKINNLKKVANSLSNLKRGKIPEPKATILREKALIELQEIVPYMEEKEVLPASLKLQLAAKDTTSLLDFCANDL